MVDQPHILETPLHGPWHSHATLLDTGRLYVDLRTAGFNAHTAIRSITYVVDVLTRSPTSPSRDRASRASRASSSG